MSLGPSDLPEGGSTIFPLLFFYLIALTGHLLHLFILVSSFSVGVPRLSDSQGRWSGLGQGPLASTSLWSPALPPPRGGFCLLGTH